MDEFLRQFHRWLLAQGFSVETAQGYVSLAFVAMDDELGGLTFDEARSLAPHVEHAVLLVRAFSASAALN